MIDNNKQTINNCIDLFNSIGAETKEKEPKIKSVFKKLFRREDFNISPALNDTVVKDITSVINILHREQNSFITAHQTAAVINSLKSAIDRLEHKTNKNEETNILLNNMVGAYETLTDISSIEKRKIDFLNQLFNSVEPPMLSEQEKENIISVLDRMTTLFGEQDPDKVKLLALFVKNNDGKEFFIDLLNKFVEVRQRNLDILSEGKPAEIDYDWFHTSLQTIVSIADPAAADAIPQFIDSINKIAIGIIGAAMPLNTQINTDGFTIGLFNRNLENDKTLRLEDTTTPRELNKLIDSAGYSTRSPQAKNRALWRDVNPDDILTGEKPFISGKRQIDFKLADGSRRTTLVELDLMPLGEMSFEQNRNVLFFIGRMGNGLTDADLHILQNHQNTGDFSFDWLEGRAQDTVKDIKKIIDDLGFSEEQTNQLIKIATDFNLEASSKLLLALFSLTPDINASCKHLLENLLGNRWVENQVPLQECLNDKNILESMKTFLDKYDELVYLQSTDKKLTEEGQKRITEVRRELKNSLGDVLNCISENKPEHLAAVNAVLLPLI